jgi:molecular chaperone HscB
MTAAETRQPLPVKCSSCNRPLESPAFCGSCHALYPADEADYFTLLGLSPCYDLDTAELRRRYLHLARGLHPDRFDPARGADAALSVRLSARLNRAHEVLADPVQRAEYMLEMAGGPAAAQDKSVPPDALAEALELREQLDEARRRGDQPAISAIAARARADRDKALAAVRELATALPGTEQLRAELRLRLNALKYHQKLLEQL